MEFANKYRSLTIPKSEKDISKNWLIQATGLTPKTGTISITGNIQDGVGFLSNLCRVSFQTESGENESILVKLLPENPEFLALTIDQEFDKRELNFYSLMKPKILEIDPELERNLCKHYCCKTSGTLEEDYASMIVLEDLKPMGYQMLDPESPKWKENLESIVKFCAKLNAVGMALENVNSSKISELFPFCMGGIEAGKSDLLLALGIQNSNLLEKFLVDENVSESTCKAYSKLCEHVEPILLKVLEKGCENPCLIHGDIWAPNVMVNEDNPTLPIKILDWQLVAYRNATYDLTVAILSCLPLNQYTKANVDYFAKFYFKEFLSSMENYGCEQKVTVGDEESFMKFFNTWGMSYAYFWFVLSLDSLMNKKERLAKVFQFIYETYNVPQFLTNSIIL